MTKLFRSHWIVAAAAAAVPLLAVVNDASAQYRVNTAGVNDANNKLGSGGRNPSDSDARTGGIVDGNDVVTGNVTGGKAFRGNVPYRNANEFRGRTSGVSLDNFIRGSTGVDGRLAEQTTEFYGISRTVQMPLGFKETGPGTGAFIPAPAGTVNRQVGDPRMGAVDLSQQNFLLPSPGELLLPGPLDPRAGQQQFITASPLTGIRQLSPLDTGPLGTTTSTEYNPSTGRLTPLQIQRMQDELNAGASPVPVPLAGAAGGAAGGTQPGATGATGAKDNAGGPLNVGQPVVQEPVALGGPGAVAIEQTPVNTAVGANGLGTNQGLRQRMLVPPQQQSALYAELWKRHQNAAEDANLTDAEASRAYNAARAQQGQAGGPPGLPGQPAQPDAAAGQPGAPGQQAGAGPRGGPPPGVIPAPPPSGVASAETDGTTAAAPAVTDFAKRNAEIMARKPGEELKRPKPAPVKVPSLGQGMKSKSLADIMNGAESLMKEGKFTAALDQYDQAEQVAPNNGLVKLGRANAELGASYYARADAHLREVFTKNPELLVGQYDLNAWLGEQRLAALVKDLKEISSKDQKESRPVFLLSYIAYNTGREQQADAYLDLADKRSGGSDPFYKLLRDNWSLPAQPTDAAPGAAPDAAKPATPDLNK